MTLSRLVRVAVRVYRVLVAFVMISSGHATRFLMPDCIYSLCSMASFGRKLVVTKRGGLQALATYVYEYTAIYVVSYLLHPLNAERLEKGHQVTALLIIEIERSYDRFTIGMYALRIDIRIRIHHITQTCKTAIVHVRPCMYEISQRWRAPLTKVHLAKRHAGRLADFISRVGAVECAIQIVAIGAHALDAGVSPRIHFAHTRKERAPVSWKSRLEKFGPKWHR